jgi:hypothetical protein
MKKFFITIAVIAMCVAAHIGPAFSSEVAVRKDQPITLRFSGLKSDGVTFKKLERVNNMRSLSNHLAKIGREKSRHQIDVALANQGGDMAIFTVSEQLGRKQFRAFGNIEGDVVIRVDGVTWVSKTNVIGQFAAVAAPTNDFLAIRRIEFLQRDGANLNVILSTTLP